jgi:hypothetical protein
MHNLIREKYPVFIPYLSFDLIALGYHLHHSLGPFVSVVVSLVILMSCSFALNSFLHSQYIYLDSVTGRMQGVNFPFDMNELIW